VSLTARVFQTRGMRSVLPRLPINFRANVIVRRDEEVAQSPLPGHPCLSKYVNRFKVYSIQRAA